VVSDLVGFVVGRSPIFGLLLWRERINRQQHVASALRAAVHAGAARLFDERSPLAVSVQPRRCGDWVPCGSRSPRATHG
jgi:hypothetical protein